MRYNYIESDPLAKRSLEILLRHQEANGSYVACPTFNNYKFAWLRDGAFCALALFESGEVESAERFNLWATATVLQHRSLFLEAISTLTNGRSVKPEAAPPTRFNLDGSVEDDHHEVWPNYQIDGYGTWLAILEKISPHLTYEMSEAVTLVADFLSLAWDKPCFDCWEEGGDLLHGSTLLAVAGGLKSAFALTGSKKYFDAYQNILEVINRDFVLSGHFVKHSGHERVDAALAWAFYPHAAYAANDPILASTMEKITDDLRGTEGGVMRYLGDSYYGGGRWILLDALVAINQTILGNRNEFEKSRNWIKSCANPELNLPEQNLSKVQDPDMVKVWEDRWGTNANPLLWSHAMYLLLLKEGHNQSWI
jgi:GH15 family glucan-1,4-alpha-glucosidase